MFIGLPLRRRLEFRVGLGREEDRDALFRRRLRDSSEKISPGSSSSTISDNCFNASGDGSLDRSEEKIKR